MTKKKNTYIISTYEPIKAWAIKKIFDELKIKFYKTCHEHFFEDGMGGYEVKIYWKFGAYVTKDQETSIRNYVKKLNYPMSDEYKTFTKGFGYKNMWLELC